MTALLDPAQLEERERRRMKQLEQQVRRRGEMLLNTSKPQSFLTLSFFLPLAPINQRAIEAQVEEKRRQKEREAAMKRKEEEEEERRLSLEREMLEKRYELDKLKERQVRKSTDMLLLPHLQVV